jgi:phosphoserine phosphatase
LIHGLARPVVPGLLPLPAAFWDGHDGAAGSTLDPVIEAVVFDLDDTLIFEEAVARASLRKVAETVGVEASGADETILARIRAVWRSGPYWSQCTELGLASWEGLWADFGGCHPSLEPLRGWIPRYQRLAWRGSLEAFGIVDEDLAEQAAETYKSLQRSGHSLRPEAFAVLTILRAYTSIGLLTNGPPDVQRTKMTTCGLSDCFDAVVISGEVGHGKPDPAAFERVVEELGAPPERSVMVGDSWERDVVGSTLAGMQAVWVSHGRPTPASADICEVVVSVADVTMDLVRSLA